MKIKQYISRAIDRTLRFIARLLGGCPICYNLFGLKKDYSRKIGYCPHCNNSFYIWIWKL